MIFLVLVYQVKSKKTYLGVQVKDAHGHASIHVCNCYVVIGINRTPINAQRSLHACILEKLTKSESTIYFL